MNKFEQAGSGNNNIRVLSADTKERNGVILPYKVEFAIAAGGANVAEVSITLKDFSGNTLSSNVPFTIWLSDSEDGIGLTATGASGTVQAKSASGYDLGILTAKKALKVQAKTGVYILEITDSAKTGFYAAVELPFTKEIAVSSQLVTASYGA